MEAASEFFTTQTLQSFGGATLVTVVVPNAIRLASSGRINAPWVGFVVAQLICLAVVYSAVPTGGGGQPISAYLVAVLNGCLVFSSAAGATAIGGASLGANDVPRSDDFGPPPTLFQRVQDAFRPWF